MKKGLGKGLGALITTADTGDTGVKEIRINDIEPNSGQPRKNFNDEKLTQLAESIKQHGVVQPLIIQREVGGYKIVAGERRWRAAKIAGLKTVPVIVRDLSDKQVMEIALIENLQREDLNPIEEAEAYNKLIEDFGMTQEEVSTTVGKSRPAIANSLRLLFLQEQIKSKLIEGEITSGHARALLAIESKSLQLKALEEIISRKLSVREAEVLVKRLNTKKKVKAKKSDDAEYKAIEDRFREVFGTKVRIMNNQKNGKIIIEYYSIDELDRIIGLVENISK
ncbi:MAG: ParB/RepB/Spo0J family partition protein [Clostridiaceae bacterium]|jgi:ParB family chromosome partitioning protein|nr:ParB/RepB/Spo0J family partition protein [Clostridiaceae bacterium]